MSEQVSTPATAQPPAEKQGNPISRWWNRQSTFGKIRTVAIALIVVIVAPIAYFASQTAPSAAEVGDCMAGQTAQSLKIVDCTDPVAEWEVVGRLSNKTEAEFDSSPNPCADFPRAELWYWEGKRGRAGFILCLAVK